ncbi:MAG: monovalent cation/H+ antiporter subunit D family protein [Geminicoccaceae bacterium]|nr:monovalent cation/H+ antiporter subunit D family protein [Geminicoccaceae bacterium]MCB2011639.1 monovalent cation/H+ antiporter subunit D family protein [Geminicoccaceae bacterium]
MNFEAHLPALQVVIPLLAAPLCFLLRQKSLAWLFSTIVTWLTFAVSVMLLAAVRENGPISYHLGGWEPPWGIEYYVDTLSALILVIVSGIGAVVMPFARISVEREVEAERIYVFYVMYLLCLTGLLGITITGDAFNLFVFLEISSLSSYVLISLGKDRRALTASFRYLIMGTIGATFYVIGIGALYMMTGTLNMADLATRLPELQKMEAALAFILVGLSLKLALFPLHLWLPNAYAFAPTVVTVFLAATATKVSVYAMIRIVYSVFGGTAFFDHVGIDETTMALGLIGMIAGSLVAIFQRNVKRLLAYSSISQIGYMMLGFSLGNVFGLAAAIVHIINHAIMKAAMFMAIGCATNQARVVSVDDLAGLGRRMPLTMAAMVVGCLSLIGVPLTVGFVSKWYLLRGAFEAGLWPIAFIIGLSGLLAVIYSWRLIEAAYFAKEPEGREEVHEAPPSMLIPLWILAGLCILLGTNASWTLDLAIDVATALIGPAGTGQGGGQ